MTTEELMGLLWVVDRSWTMTDVRQWVLWASFGMLTCAVPGDLIVIVEDLVE